MEQRIGKPPACIECVHVELRPAKVLTEEGRRIDGRAVDFLCTRACDPLTGQGPEFCYTERTAGVCGPRGLFFEQADAPPTVMMEPLVVDDADFAEVDDPEADSGAEEIEEVVD